MKNMRWSWLVGGAVVLIVLLGLFIDVWRSYSVRKSLEYDVRKATEIAAQCLPFRPQEAVYAGVTALEERGVKADPGSVTVAPDGYSMKISVISDVVAYFAWIVGNPRMKFQAEAEATVKLEGGGPVDEMKASEVAFALVKFEGMSIGSNVVISPSGDATLPEYAIRAFAVAGSDPLKVGEVVTVSTTASLEDYSSPRQVIVAILDTSEGGRGLIQGFAALDATGLDDRGRIMGRFIRSQVGGTLLRQLPADNDFGLYRGGTPRVEVR